ncbi:hypothetical protein CERSUDRAFT_119201 [Gelatoporia subvermispora B]|uniref:C2H2-type domain-containing protein n=1 Tax=Ceriporiopsis subvermispora (strain B) TaxID=914234 RepID=M2Q523_CERS8|nr:hypothetical protein CERSUDRAFT_119201 [Gelatoporia subvermispora B]
MNMSSSSGDSVPYEAPWVSSFHPPRVLYDRPLVDEPAHDAILATSDNLQTFCVDENMVPGPGDASRLEHPRCAQAYHYYHRIELGNTADVSGGTYAHVMRDADASRQVVSIHAGQDHRRYPQFDGAPEYCPIQPLGIQPMHQNSIDSESAVDNSPTVGSVMLCQFRDSGCGQLIPRSSSSAVRRHLTRFHPWLRNLREDCSVLCGWGGWCMETVQFRSLARHIFHKHRPHSGAVCDICGKRLSRLDAVKRHQGSTACYRQLGGTGTYPDMDHVKGTDNLTPTTWILQ